jgi:hypothetical protein
MERRKVAKATHSSSVVMVREWLHPPKNAEEAKLLPSKTWRGDRLVEDPR